MAVVPLSASRNILRRPRAHQVLAVLNSATYATVSLTRPFSDVVLSVNAIILWNAVDLC